MNEPAYINLDLCNHYLGVIQHLQDALHAQQMDLIQLRQGRDELTRELLRMQAQRPTPPAEVK